jgi:predicted CXXCH cytochrome family protein
MRYWISFFVIIVISLLVGGASAKTGIIDTKHNLSVSGPGDFHALSEDRICVFCHTPHNAFPYTPLWNRDLQPRTYTLYQSSSLSALPWQPSGPTRLCLSCHDGTIALGDVLRPAEGIDMNMEITAARRSHIDTNISDDHPVSFNYYDALPNSEMAQIIPAGLMIYGDGDIHCNTCHDPHDNTYGKFLVKDNEFSALCLTCHENKSGWNDSIHSSSVAVWNPPAVEDEAKSVAAHGCEGCHVPHNAGGPQRLLRNLAEEENCYPCHDGTVDDVNIKSQFVKLSHHPVENTTIGVTENYHDPTEEITLLQGHVECLDCHNPHAVNKEQAAAPAASGSLSLVAGKDKGNSIVDPVSYQYELCFKCHGYSSELFPFIYRWINETNTILEFDPGNPSYHPVVAVGRNGDMRTFPSIYEPQLLETSMIYCVDCHDSDESSRVGGAGPSGPHGSIYRPILRQRYETSDFQAESEAAYMLCYRCHDRAKLLVDPISGDQFHLDHVVGQNAPCSICHDPHGVEDDGHGDHTYLINFDLNSVLPTSGNAFPLYEDTGFQPGSCTLICHGKTHDG